MQIILEDNRNLRKKAKRVAKIDDTIRNLCVSMFHTMLESNGVGLAAPQVDVSKQIIVVLLDDNIPMAFINPEIIKSSEEEVLMEEGCLSIPGKIVEKMRPKDITIKYRDIAGHPRISSYTDLNARIIQHEIDHLNGVLMVD